MHIWVIKLGEPVPLDGENVRLGRAGQLSKWLSSNGHVVRFFNGTFYHQERQQRFSETKDFSIAPNFNLTLLQSRPYQRSVSLARLRSHADAAAEFNRWVRTNSEKPDVIFCAYPVEELCRAAARFGRINNIPVVMDCRDFWPDIFAERLPGPLQLAAPLIFGTFERDARNTLGTATALCGHTESALQWGLHKAGRARRELDFHFPFTYPAKPVAPGTLADEKIRICFAGTLSRRSDLGPWLRAIGKLPNAVQQNLIFEICGAGEALEDLQNAAKGSGAQVIFHGWVDAKGLRDVMERCDFGLLPYTRKDFHLSLPNKFAEYLAFGLPVLSCTEGEIHNFIKTHQCGVWSPADERGIVATLSRLEKNQPEFDKSTIHKIFLEHFQDDAVFGHAEAMLQRICRATDNAGPEGTHTPNSTSETRVETHSTSLAQDHLNYERDRYNQAARQSLAEATTLQLSSTTCDASLAAPYAYFEKSVMEIVPAGASVAEFGASAGENTLAALLAGAHVTAVDVADEALALLKRRLPPEFKDRVTTLHSSFETCPLEDESCDHILSAGSLSYVENDKLIAEAVRLLKPGGSLIAVDSWNHNPIYRLNRFIQYVRGKRTGMTVRNMPSRNLIRLFRQNNFEVRQEFFGVLSFLIPIMRPFMSSVRIGRLIDQTDRLLWRSQLAFKTVIIATKKDRQQWGDQ